MKAGARAAEDVHRAKVFGRCEATIGIDPFNRLIDQVMTCEPYASRTSGVLSGRQRLLPPRSGQHRCPTTLYLLHLPVHASWLNQVEIYFSVAQRKVVSPNDFHSIDEVAADCSTYSSTTNRSPHRSNGIHQKISELPTRAHRRPRKKRPTTRRT